MADPVPGPPGSPPRPKPPADDDAPLPRRREPKPRRDRTKPKAHRLTRGERKARKKGRRIEARRVHRVVRHVEPWSVLKFSLLLYFSLFLIVLSAGVLLWLAASATDVIGGIEDFVEELFGFETFAFEPGQILTGAVLGGLVLVIAGSAANVVFAVLFNLISDVVGGLRVTVIEEETLRRVPRSESKRHDERDGDSAPAPASEARRQEERDGGAGPAPREEAS